LADRLEENAAASSPSVSPPDADVLNAEEAMAVRSALGKLPQEQRKVIELAFFAGLTHPEIAERLNEPLGTIKARIRRGLLKLREGLQLKA
jgi:RNA polymerase sigma-70 factor (ECF subfamily)